MVWRKTSPLAKQLLHISEIVGSAAEGLRKQANVGQGRKRRR